MALDQLREKAKALVELKLKHSNVIRATLSDIEKLKISGVKYTQIVDVLAQVGVKISERSLVNFISRERARPSTLFQAPDYLSAVRRAMQGFEAKVKQLSEIRASSTVTLKELTPQIEQLDSLGIERENLVSMLRESGIEISAGTFKSLLSRVRAENNAFEGSVTSIVQGEFRSDCVIPVHLEQGVNQSLLKVVAQLNAGVADSEKIGVPELLAMLAEAAATIYELPESDDADHLRAVLGM